MELFQHNELLLTIQLVSIIFHPSTFKGGSEMLLTVETCAVALRAAATNYKAAIQLELSVGLAVFHMQGGTSNDARSMLKSVYAAAGWSCMRFADDDYKTVNRRINATASLYEKVPVAKWVGHLSDMDVIQAISEGLAPYELYTIQDVLRYSTPSKRKYDKTPVAPSHDILSGPVAPTQHTGQERVMQQFRRVSDQAGEGMRRLSTEHLSVSIPKDIGRDELIDLAMQLMSLAKNNEEKLLTV